MLVALDIFFFVFHTLLTVFNLVGWAFRKTRRLNLITLVLTAFSWLVLGIFYGFGYCFLTDWHWDVREQLGYDMRSNSYIHFLVTALTPITVSENTVDIVAAVVFFLAFAASIGLNLRDWKRSRQHRQTDRE